MSSPSLPLSFVIASALLVAACEGAVVPRPYPEWNDNRGDAGPDPVDDAGFVNEKDAGPLDSDAGPSDAGSSDAGPGDAGPVEMRGLWITRFAYTSEADLTGILDRAAAANFNAVFVQVRGNGDAYYDSPLEPWAMGLTGVLGRDPGWDPLAVAVEHGHSLGLEVHAYVNALSAWPATLGDVPQAEGDQQHPLYDHPEWTAVTPSGVNEDEEYIWFAPIPEVQAHTAAVVTDLLTRYDVDGLHLDRIRMPASNYSHDAVSTQLFSEAQADDASLTFPVFMRGQVSAVVESVFDALIATRPEAQLSAAVWGIYERFPGCSTSQGLADYHQDSVGWVQQGIMDVLVPMIYWPEEDGACTDFRALTEGFVDDSAPNKLWAGVHALEIREGYTFDKDKLSGRLATALDVGAEGSVIFASTYFDQDATRWDALVGDETDPGAFFEPVTPPGPALR